MPYISIYPQIMKEEQDPSGHPYFRIGFYFDFERFAVDSVGPF